MPAGLHTPSTPSSGAHTAVALTTRTLDTFHIRQQIFARVRDLCARGLSGRLLDIGCGRMPYRDYILSHSGIDSYVGLDLAGEAPYDRRTPPDFTWDGVTMPFANHSFDCAMATEVMEHCPVPAAMLAEVHRVLKPGGVFFFTVPFLWNLHDIPHDEYRYTPFALTRLLGEAGFRDISLVAHGGWHASLAQMLGLWVRRAPLSSRRRRVLSLLLKPVIAYLLHHDSRMQWDFSKPLMITGLSGTAVA